jgi:DNA-binding beta-propeller fold protein YncE
MKWLAVPACAVAFLLLPIGGLLAQMNSNSTNSRPRNLLLVANQGDLALSLIDADAGKEVARVPTEEVRAHEVAVSADGRLAYLPIYGNSGVGQPGTDGHSIEIVDLEKRSVVQTIELGHGVRPHCVKLGPDGLLYVSAELDHAVDVFDPQTQKLVASVPTEQPESHMVVISHDGKRAYTSNVGPGTVSVLDLVSRKTVKVIPVAKTDQRISMSVDGRYVFTSDESQPRLAVIDTAKNEVSQWLALPAVGYGTAPTLDGRWLLVTMQHVNQVAVVDLSQMKVVKTIDVPANPVQILMRPDRPLAYVSCSGAGKVAVIDLKNWQVAQTIDAGKGADGMAWAGSH